MSVLFERLFDGLDDLPGPDELDALDDHLWPASRPDSRTRSPW